MNMNGWLTVSEHISNFGHLNPIVVKAAVVLFKHFSADLLKAEDFNFLFVVPPLKFEAFASFRNKIDRSTYFWIFIQEGIPFHNSVYVRSLA
jgi:hypothetical protein